MRGICKGCDRETVIKANELCQKCWHKENKPIKTKLKIRKTCIFCGWKRTWEAYKPNWKCDKCEKCQFEHDSMKQYRGKEHLIEGD